MIETVTGFNQFELADFFANILKFIKDNGLSIYIIGPPDQPLQTKDLSNDVLETLIKEEKALFFPFSDINNGEPVICADGNSYQIPDPEGREGEISFLSSEVECIGFSLELNEGKIYINPAVFKCGECLILSGIEFSEDFPLIEAPISRYINQFIKK